jgi:phenylalanyl-tRNA synthetase beta chain
LPFKRDGEDFIVTPPSYRFDIEIEEDLIEEIARLHGYDNIPAPAPRAAWRCCRRPNRPARYRACATSWPTRLPGSRQLRLRRRSLGNRLRRQCHAHPSGQPDRQPDERDALHADRRAGRQPRTNLKRKQNRVRVFETGRCFSAMPVVAPVEGFHQPWKLAGLAYGGALPEQWGSRSRNVDFFDVKGEVERCWPRVGPLSRNAPPGLASGA